MLNQFVDSIFILENVLWGYIGVPLILLLGIILTYNSNFFQVRKLPVVIKNFICVFNGSSCGPNGISPLKVFFASIGGGVGVGNVVGVCTAVQIGGPGALFWIWMTALAGAVVKYGEVYLGMKYRVEDGNGGFTGGPMYYMRHVLDKPWISTIVCCLLCVYGVEIYQFSVLTNSISTNLGLNFYAVSAIFLMLILFAGSGGVKRVGSISTFLIPLFVSIYAGMGLWVLVNNIQQIPSVFNLIISSAFNGHAALGGFAGSTLMLAMSHGIRRGCYSGDIGIGYASVIHSESSTPIPEKQASLVIFEIFMDTFVICTTSVMLILVTGVWQEPVDGIMLVQMALSKYFPYMHLFMPLFLFLVGYATINAYLCVGLKCAEYLMPKYGRGLYYLYAISVLTFFSFFDTILAQSVMAIAGGFLLIINSWGIFVLRHEISYNLDSIVVGTKEGATKSKAEAEAEFNLG
ncbi:MAG: sodium:alanine symporter family protein [Parachlamydiaceae bacterium]|nr:sodium:alanine symporter family protein [Parachlamydiaceae bacterium]